MWDSADAARAGIELGLSTTDLLKISEEELTFITGETEINVGMALLRARGVPVVIVTLGAEGCAYSWGEYTGHVPSVPVKQVDATGAGDAFIGAVLYRLTRETPVALNRHPEEIEDILAFANLVAATVVTRRGAIPAMPTLEEL
ncbi:MAG: 2-dehydro-3-deoxygluconokinase [bacterium ADurb.Bin429]|nr:MAG: 2-dehydro-3-deoxygluconokinase [bacterium ADurb.Bin429]